MNMKIVRDNRYIYLYNTKLKSGFIYIYLDAPEYPQYGFDYHTYENYPDAKLNIKIQHFIAAFLFKYDTSKISTRVQDVLWDIINS